MNAPPILVWTEWVSVKDRKPPCARSQDALGTEVLIWPRDLADIGATAYYGRRATGRPAFYKYGAALSGVTHWAYLPGGPVQQRQGTTRSMK